MNTRERILKTINKTALTYQQIIDRVRAKSKQSNSQSIERMIRHMVAEGELVKGTKKEKREGKIKNYAVFSKGDNNGK